MSTPRKAPMMPKIVEVTWRDSWTNTNQKWRAEDFKNEPDFILNSVGYLVHQDKRGVNIVGEYRQEDKCGRQAQHIPKAMILKIRKITK